MTKVLNNVHVQHKLLTGTAVVPTVPSPTTLTAKDAGWKSTDIHKGEIAHNLTDDKWYYRNDNDQILEFGADKVISFNGRTGAVSPAINDYTWAQIDKTLSNLKDIATRKHSDLTGIGTNTHVQIDNHIAATNNPHLVTADQVGRTTAQWNANRILGTLVVDTDKGAGKVLKIDPVTLNLVYDDESVSSVFGRTGDVVAVANDYTWAQIDKTVSDIADIATKSHTSLTDIGTNTHAQIDTHIAATNNPHSVTKTQVGLANVLNVEQVENGGGAPKIIEDLIANRPASATAGILFFATDENKLYRDNGATWDLILSLDHTDLANIGTNTHAQIDTHIASSSNPHSVTKTQVGLGNVEDLKVNLVATTAPAVTDDSGDGYSVGSRWFDVTNDKEYVCLDATVGAAVWTETTGGGGSTLTQAEQVTLKLLTANSI